MTHRTTIRIVVTMIVAAEAAVAWNLLVTDADPDDPLPSVGECTPDGVDPGYAALCDHVPPVDLTEAVEVAASEYGLDPWMVAVTVHRESGCDQYALGSAGEVGLAQVNPSVWMDTLRREGIARRPQELYDVQTNLRAAAYVLRRTHDAADGDLFGTFRRYNGRGPKARQYAREQVAAYTAHANSNLW